MNRHRVLGELVTFKNTKEFHHDGILYEAGKLATVVHVHGSFGNFYQNSFLRVMAQEYTGAGINLLLFNLRGHDGIAEGYRHEWDFEYAGGAITSFDDCVDDIQAAIDFVSPLTDRIILQGHSLGCDRVLQYVLAARCDHDLVLLSPCDSYQLQSRWIDPETVEGQIERLKGGENTGKNYDWLPLSEYGIRQADWDYPIPITRSTLLTLMEGPAFRLVRMDRPSDFHLNQRILLYLGGDDTLQTVPREVMLKYFADRARAVTLTSLYPEGDHSLWGCEREVSTEVVQWIKTPVRYQPKT